MGDLPTLEDVMKKRFAKLEDYAEAEDIINHELNKLHEEGKLYGAAIYGSTKNKEIRIGSDIDLFVIAYSINSCMGGLQALRSQIKDMHITLEINPLLSSRQAKEGRHGMESLFLDYLKSAISYDGRIGDYPFRILNENPKSISQELEFISRHESGLRRMTRDCTQPLYTKGHCKFLSRMLNYTLFIPMDMYAIKHNGSYNGDFAKPALVELYKEEFPDIDATALDNALLFWKETNNILSREEVNLDDYKGILSWFGSQYDITERFILDNMKLVERYR